MKQRDLDALQTIREKCESIISFTIDLSQKEFDDNETVIAATMWNITIIGEAANRLSDEIQEKYPDISFRPAISMRHRIVHGYDTVDLDTVYKVATFFIPEMLNALNSNNL
jgi:uncharacterized protein with HEPN domain